MKNNTLAVTRIILLSIIVLILTAILIILLVKPNDITFFGTNEKASLVYDEDITVPINNIKINSISADIEIREVEQEQINMKIYSSKKEDVTYTTNNDTLEIKDNTNHSCIGFCNIESNNIIITIPKESVFNIDIETISGDVNVESNLNTITNIKTTSGDIDIQDAKKSSLTSVSGDISVNKVGDLKLKTTSGDIEIEEIAKSCDIKTISGEIDIEKVNLENNSKIETKSGDVEISKTDSYIVTETTSGETRTSNNNRYSKTELYIKTISGDITAE